MKEQTPRKAFSDQFCQIFMKKKKPLLKNTGLFLFYGKIFYQ